MELGFDGEIVFITGGSKGIGLASAKLFAEEGCSVAIVARDGAVVDEAVAEIDACGPGEVLGLTGDMTRTEDVEAAVAATLRALRPHRHARDLRGRIARRLARGPDRGAVVRVAAPQVHGLCARLPGGAPAHARARQRHGRARGRKRRPQADPLRGHGGRGQRGGPQLRRAIAEEYGKHGIRVNTVNPGPVDTDRWDLLEKKIAETRGISQAEAREFVSSSIPIGRICTAEEVANLVVFLASSRASFVNGTHLVVDGGQRKALMDVPV